MRNSRLRQLALNEKEQACLNAFYALNYSGFEFERYPEFFGETGFMRLAVAGTFVGPQAMFEYLSFAGSANPYAESVLGIAQSDINFKSMVNNDTACQFHILDTTRYETNQDAANKLVAHVS